MLAVLALSVARDRSRGDRSGVPAPITSIAVLPFDNLGRDPEQDYFVDGMTDAIITNLAQVRALRVISRTSVTQYERTDKLLPRIAEDLNVDAIVEGTVMRSGDRVRVTAQLIHAATDRHLWARTYERELRDVLALQAELAAAIAQAVQVKVQPEEQRRLAARGTVDPEAYDAYLKGRFFWNKRSPQGIAKGIEYFQQAIDRDPTYAPAYSGLSDAYRMSGLATLPPREYMPKAEAAARKALALDETLAEAHSSLAGVLYRYHWDWEGAEREFQRCLELDPNYAEGHRAYAIYLLTVRRHEEAVAEARRARELSPLSPVINVELATALVRVGRYDEAIQQVQRTLEIDRKFFRAYATLALAYEGQGDRSKAVAALEKAVPCGGPECQSLARVHVRSDRAAGRGAGDRGAAGEALPRALHQPAEHRRRLPRPRGQGPGHVLAGEILRGALLRDARLLGGAVRRAGRRPAVPGHAAPDEDAGAARAIGASPGGVGAVG